MLELSTFPSFRPDLSLFHCGIANQHLRKIGSEHSLLVKDGLRLAKPYHHERCGRGPNSGQALVDEYIYS